MQGIMQSKMSPCATHPLCFPPHNSGLIDILCYAAGISLFKCSLVQGRWCQGSGGVLSLRCLVSLALCASPSRLGASADLWHGVKRLSSQSKLKCWVIISLRSMTWLLMCHRPMFYNKPLAKPKFHGIICALKILGDRSLSFIRQQC